MRPDPSPPRLAEGFARLVLPSSEREFVLGDLAEGYAVREQDVGKRAASRWYWGQVTRSILPLLTFERGWEVDVLRGLKSDIVGGIRQFQRNYVFASVVVLTVAIGVGGSTAVFSVLNGVVLKPLAFHDSERVVTLWGQSPDYPRVPLTVGDHNVLAENVTAFQAVTAEWGNTALLLGEGDAEQVSVGWVTPNYFQVLATTPYLGRILGPEDESAVVIAHELWVRRYGSDPQVIGRVIDVAGTPMEIVGILGPGDDPNLTSFSGGRASNRVWRLQPADWTQGDDRSVGWLRSSARLNAGVTVAAAQAEVDALMERINATVTDRDGGSDLRVNVKPVRADLVGGVAPMLWVLLAAVCGVLLIAATNVANLMLGRAQSRAGEVAVRAAMGGSRTRLFRQLLIESAMLAAAGGVLGVFVAWAGMQALVAAAPATLPRAGAISLDPRVLLFAVAATSVAALFFGMLPAIRGSRTELTSTLSARRTTSSRGDQRMSRGLVIVQVALSLGLLVGTGLLLRSLHGLGETDLGFEKGKLLTFALETPDLGDTAPEAAARLNDYISRVESTPGVVSAGLTNRVPLGGGLFTSGFRSLEMVEAEAEAAQGSYRFVTPNYFDAMGARLLAGRWFTASDGEDVVIIDEHVAEQLWPGENPLGRRLEQTAIGADPVIAEVVGVTAPMKHTAVAEETRPTVFLAMLPVADRQNFRYMVARTSGDPLTFIEPIRQALRQVDVNTVMARIRPMSTLYAQSVASTRFAGQLLAVFGIIALTLAVVGLHGVMSLAVRRRQREFGIRVALGATHGVILKRVLKGGLYMVGLGSVLGIGLSLALAGYLGSLLYGIAPTDTPSLVAATSAILIVGVLASYLPARRVLRVDPAHALRSD